MKSTSAAYKSEPQEVAASSNPQAADESNPGLFLAGVAGLLRETVQRFESMSSSVTDSVMSRSGMADRELIVSLQAFDRLQQEFVAVADVLARYSSAFDNLPIESGHERLQAEAISAIAVSDLKQRLLNHLNRDRSNELNPAPDGEEEF